MIQLIREINYSPINFFLKFYERPEEEQEEVGVFPEIGKL